jgi:hypothetical protein
MSKVANLLSRSLFLWLYFALPEQRLHAQELQPTTPTTAICNDQVYPPKGIDKKSDSFHNPLCLPNRRLAFTVWHNGYNGWDKAGKSQLRTADIYILRTSSQQKSPFILGPKGVDKVNNIGHAVIGDYITYNCNWDRVCVSSLRDAKDFQMFERPADKAEGRFQEPGFDPTGKFIVFEWTKQEVELEDRGQADICSMRRDGSNLHCAGFMGYNKQPSWSPRGNRIVFQRQCADKGCWHLWIANINSDGTIDDKSAMELTTEYASNTDASWSPSGKSIIFSCGNGPKATVCVMDAAVGARPVVIPQVTAPYNGAISWCNDGHIYFEAGQATEPQQPTSICRVAVPAEMRDR